MSSLAIHPSPSTYLGIHTLVVVDGYPEAGAMNRLQHDDVAPDNVHFEVAYSVICVEQCVCVCV